MHIGYKRVSTEDQSTARQLVGIELQRVYEDKASGATKDRPQLKACLDALREGDTLHVHAVDRLKAKATLIIYSPRLEFGYQSDDYLQTFQLQLFAIVGQLERAMSRHRQKEGIAAAKKNGTKSGKPWGKQPLCPTLKPKAIDLFNQGISITTIATDLGISRGSVYNLLKGQTKTVQY
jgi:DNA invertase Pin-like site-specific DNA recombinase